MNLLLEVFASPLFWASQCWPVFHQPLGGNVLLPGAAWQARQAWQLLLLTRESLSGSSGTAEGFLSFSLHVALL